MSVGDLLQWLSLAQKTGTLTVTSRDVEKKVSFRKGRVISSASSDPREYLGQFLMSHGYITEDELNKAMQVQRESRILLGKILVTIEAISEEDLIRLMRLKVGEEICDVFLWADGEFRFVDDELPTMQMVPLQVDITGIIMEGSRRADEWTVIREVVPGGGWIPVLKEQPDDSSLTEARRMILQAVNGHRSIDEIVLESRSSTFNVSRTLYELVREKRARLLPPKAPPVEKEPLPPPSQPPTEMTADDEITSLLARAQSSIRQGEFERALRSLKLARDLAPENGSVRNAMKGTEILIREELRKQGIVANKVPKLVRELEQMSDMNFSANEGFILSRINGQWDVDSIIRISPLRETDALLIFHELMKRGVIELA